MVHPFNFAYPIQCSKDVNVINELYRWTASEYGVLAPEPTVLVVNHEHMQRAASRSSSRLRDDHHVLGWYSQRYKQMYVSDRVRPSKRKQCAAVVVHECVHYLQDMTTTNNDVKVLENEADTIMMKFLRMCSLPTTNIFSSMFAR